MKHKNRLLAFLIAAVMLSAMLLPAMLLPAAAFNDVPEDAWYYQAVDYADGRGWLNGYGGGSFGPTDTLTRGMLAQVFYNWEQRPYADEEKPWAGTVPFADVKAGAWYENTVNWARSEKVMQGDGTNFNPNGKLTRQEMAVALYGFARYKGVDRSGSADLSAYADGGDVAGWAKQAVSWALSNDMFHIEGSALAPTAPVQRAELAYALMMLNWNTDDADMIRLMAGAVQPGGSTLEVKDCAVMIEYHFHTGDWNDSDALPISEVVKRAEETAKANGYAPITAVGEGSKIYAAMEPWEDGVALVALGEDGTFKLCAQAAAAGQNRRAAQKYILWDAEDWDGWRVYSVEEQDYYEENGQQYPCFSIVLIPG